MYSGVPVCDVSSKGMSKLIAAEPLKPVSVNAVVGAAKPISKLISTLFQFDVPVPLIVLTQSLVVNTSPSNLVFKGPSYIKVGVSALSVLSHLAD